MSCYNCKCNTCVHEVAYRRKKIAEPYCFNCDECCTGLHYKHKTDCPNYMGVHKKTLKEKEV